MGDPDKEDDTSSIINDKELGKTENKVPEDNIPSSDEGEIPILKPGADHNISSSYKIRLLS